MSARSDARKQFAKEQELEKLRKQKELRDQARAVKKEQLDEKLATMTPNEATEYMKKVNRPKVIAAAVIGLIFLSIIIAVASGSSSSSPNASTVTSTSSTPTPDAGSQLACDHFRNVMSDLSGGLLTDAEFRTKLQEIYSDAWVSTESGIAENAKSMLASFTSGDSGGTKTAMAGFSAACTAIGH